MAARWSSLPLGLLWHALWSCSPPGRLLDNAVVFFVARPFHCNAMVAFAARLYLATMRWSFGRLSDNAVVVLAARPFPVVVPDFLMLPPSVSEAGG